MKTNNKKVSIHKNSVQADYEIKQPTEAAIGAIASDMKLTSQQIVALRTAIDYAFSQIDRYKQKNHSPQKRKDLISRMCNLEKVLTKLDYEITRSQSYMSEYLPFDVLEMIGTRSSPAFVKEILGDKSISSSIDRQIALEFTETGKVDLAKIDSFLRPILQAVGLKHGPKLFARYIQDQLIALVTWRLLNSDGSKQRPTLIYRQHLVRVLILHSEQILGKRAAKSPNGKFVVLCEEVLTACGLQGSTIGPSIPKLVEGIYPSDPARKAKKKWVKKV